MRSAKVWRRILCLAAAAGCSAGWVLAEDVEKKFRIGGGLGFLNQQGQIESDSTNALLLVDADESAVDFYRDPRNDSAAFGTLELRSGALGAISGQYAATKTFLIDLSVGYQRTDAGDIEVQAQFNGVYIPNTQPFLFDIFRIEAGDIEQVPVQLTFLARFRPRASFNPYIGGGFGYTFVGFEPSDAFNELSVNLDNSQGQQWAVGSGWLGLEDVAPKPGAVVRDLDGAGVDIDGYWDWHVAGGFELSFKRKWAIFLDLRYAIASREATFTFDGAEELGSSVPNLTDFCSGNTPPPPGAGDDFAGCPGSIAGEQAINGEFGPVFITSGGLIDGGQLVPIDDLSLEMQAQYCDLQNPNVTTCFVPEPDGQLDLGNYYVQGGSLSLDAFSALVGVRFTF